MNIPRVFSLLIFLINASLGVSKYSRSKVINAAFADGCAVKGFRCVNDKYPSNAGISVDSDSNVIVNNSCEKNNYSICLDWRSSCNTIENNTCFENCDEGIQFSYSSNNLIIQR